MKADTCSTQTKIHYLQASLDALPRRYYSTLECLIISARIAIHAAAIVVLMLPFLSSPSHTAAVTTTAAAATVNVAEFAAAADVAVTDVATLQTSDCVLLPLLLLLLLLLLVLPLLLLLLLLLLLMYNLSLWASARAAVSMCPLQHSSCISSGLSSALKRPHLGAVPVHHSPLTASSKCKPERIKRPVPAH
jgi:hypothetical protein